MKRQSGSAESKAPTELTRAAETSKSSRDYAAYAVFGLALAFLIISGIFTVRHLSKTLDSTSGTKGPGWTEEFLKQGRDLLDRFSGGAVSRQDPGREAKSHLQKGRRLYSKSRLKEALEECAEATRLDPQNPEACYWKGRVLIRLQRYDEAFEDFQKAVGLRPDYREAHDNLAWLHERNKEYDQALSHLNKSIQLAQDNAWAYFHRAWVFHRKGERQKALEDAKRACELKSQDGCRLYEEYKKRISNSE
jgi:tetratricopeptide (TPR) repeat protein